MILIADGGSTKCDWIILNTKGKVVLKTRTEGLNPAVFGIETLRDRLFHNTDLFSYKSAIEKIFFYGAGCGTEKPKQTLKELFESYFTNAIIEVKEDTYAAVHASTDEPGIVCILGTGSNSCYFDGDQVQMTIPSLGYILMDEASGNYFGKKLIRDYFYKKMPENLRKEFGRKFNLEADVIKLNLYKKENPNTYLASFAQFMFANERGDYFNDVLKKGIKDFFKNRIRIYDNYQEIPVHFIGSIAHFSSDIIREVARKNKVTIGKIIQRPIDGLIQYHQNILK